MHKNVILKSQNKKKNKMAIGMPFFFSYWEPHNQKLNNFGGG